MVTNTNNELNTAKNIGNEDGNNLFPVFLKIENLRVLIIGGGYVAGEKLSAILTNAPATKVTMVAIHFSDEVKEIAANNTNINLIERVYQKGDLTHADVIFVAVNDIVTSKIIMDDAHAIGKLVNVADKPELCDYYLGSVVKKGNLKIGISTNGKSPTIAKRLKETLDEALPDELNTLLENMEVIRKKLKGDFTEKVKRLDKITESLSPNTDSNLGW